MSGTINGLTYTCFVRTLRMSAASDACDAGTPTCGVENHVSDTEIHQMTVPFGRIPVLLMPCLK